MDTIKIHPGDNVAVALKDIVSGGETIRRGHKIALTDIAAEAKIIKYGFPIGSATRDIKAGEWVHTQNMRTDLSGEAHYEYKPRFTYPAREAPRRFDGFLREDGSAGVRNELWIIPTVGCVNGVAQKAAVDNVHLVEGSVEGIYAFPHPFGCSQMGADHEQTKRLLASLVKHPNAGGVLVLGLGCENNTMEQFKEALGSWDEKRVKFLVCQEAEDELAECARLLKALAEYASGFQRRALPVSKLIVGMKCGGSDGLSGITANPVVGKFSDKLIAQGGSTILTEVPEMFGAEQMLMERCVDKKVFDSTVKMIDGFKEYFTGHGQVVYENPSPGNKQGGITTLEDKSCGCVQKGGSAPVADVIGYGERVKTEGLTLLSGPGNDLVSATALTAAGAQIILFTTGRGTPFGAPAPTVKISTNSDLASRKKDWTDFNAGTVAEGEPLEAAGNRLMDYVISVASGARTKSEENGYREIAIFKGGVVL